MKKVFLTVLTLIFIAGCGKPFEEAHKQSVDELKSRKNQAISMDDFYNKYLKDKTELQINAQKEEWKKNNNWPVISFNQKIFKISDTGSSSTNFVDKNKKQFAHVSLESYKFEIYNSKSINPDFYFLKKEAMSLKDGQNLKGYGIISSFMYSNIVGFIIGIYPVIIE